MMRRCTSRIVAAGSRVDRFVKHLARAMKSPRKAAESNEIGAPNVEAQKPPLFKELLGKPLLQIPLPKDFDIEVESKHLTSLWNSTEKLRSYNYLSFVHAGGSGMVFKVSPQNSPGVTRALKIVREKLLKIKDAKGQIATTLSPVSQAELRALEKLSHPHLVRLYDVVENERGIIGLCTTYVDAPKPLDLYFPGIFEKDPKKKLGIHAFSPQRLDGACDFLAKKCQEIASALRHMHNEKIFHLDIKPANILISGTKQCVLTDMGSCVHTDNLPRTEEIRVYFTWTYAHPELRDIVSDPRGLTGGGLKSSAAVKPEVGLARFDLFAFGKTLQEMLAIIEGEFGERCHASYGFRYLHIIACLLLDGHNTPIKPEPNRNRVVNFDGRYFAHDVALDYPPQLFEMHKITSAEELVERLARYGGDYAWNQLAPELNPWQPDILNSVAHAPAPFTHRVAMLFNHPCVRRLKKEHQLGWMREVYPGATHDRWSHSVGVFSALVGYYNALLSDPAVPTFRILINREDISHAFVAALLHDLGQTTFGHDLEEVCPSLFSHEEMLSRVLEEEYFGRPPLLKVLETYWPEVDVARVFSILQHRKGTGDKGEALKGGGYRAVDGIGSDAIDGPIDADKFDYLLRDSIACGVSYGHGMDPQRFLQALTVTASRDASLGSRLVLAYKAKGRPAIEALLIARYQMYGAVYWHHTFRCIKSMFDHAAATTFSGLERGPKEVRGQKISLAQAKEVLYQRIICRKSWSECREAMSDFPADFFLASPSIIDSEPSLDFVWQFADDRIRELLLQLAKRTLYKRIFEMRLGELGERADYSAMKAEFAPEKRLQRAARLQQYLLDAVLNEMRKKGAVTTASESAAKRRHEALVHSIVPQLLLDFPVRGVSSELNFPKEIGDPERKYFTLPSRGTPDDNVFHVVRKLQERMASVRIFVSPDFHELIIRYLTPTQIQSGVEAEFSLLKRQQ